MKPTFISSYMSSVLGLTLWIMKMCILFHMLIPYIYTNSGDNNEQEFIFVVSGAYLWGQQGLMQLSFWVLSHSEQWNRVGQRQQIIYHMRYIHISLLYTFSFSGFCLYLSFYLFSFVGFFFFFFLLQCYMQDTCTKIYWQGVLVRPASGRAKYKISQRSKGYQKHLSQS